MHVTVRRCQVLMSGQSLDRECQPRTKSDADADLLGPFGDQITERTVESERSQGTTETR
jgi:hypothetical protein